MHVYSTGIVVLVWNKLICGYANSILQVHSVHTHTHTHTHTHILSEDREPTGLKVDIAQLWLVHKYYNITDITLLA